jgi:hypothetical protein
MPIFTPDIVKDMSVVLSETQQLMINSIIDHILNPIEDYAGKILISSGLRTLADRDRLIKQGYNPSKTSDHFYGFMPFTSGAADFVLSTGSQGTFDLYYDLYRRYDKTKNRIVLPKTEIEVGQMILEKNKSYWIHIANPRRMFYSDKCPLPGKMFLKSEDNGKTYINP